LLGNTELSGEHVSCFRLVPCQNREDMPVKIKKIIHISTKQAPSSGGHTQPAELILCTSSFKRATFKKPDAARLSN